MEALFQKLMLLRSEVESKTELSNARKRALTAVGFVLGLVAACIIGYVIFSMSTPGGIAGHIEIGRPSKPDMFVCSGESAQPSMDALRRSKRQRPTTNGGSANLIKRIARPLSLPPPALNLNFSYNPPLYHDAGARCAWGHLSNKRVPHLEDVGVAYDFQQLEARSCDDPEECKSMCLRMHKTDDPYLCNYFTWHRQKKLALFYFLEPTLKWNLTDDNRVETFFWQCRETRCDWWWRPHRVWTHLSDLTAPQLRKAPNLLAVTQCTDFASCQFSCETRPSFKEIGLGNQIPASANPEDPSCAYVVMPSKGTQNRESFLFTMPQSDLKNVSYRGSSSYDSFELICHDVETTPHPTIQPSSPIPVAPAVPVAVPLAAAVPPPPPPPPAFTNANATQKRHLSKRSTNKIQDEIKIHKCHSHGQEIDCAQLQLQNKNQPSECVRLNSESMGKTPTSMSIESKRPLWLILQHQSDDFEQSVQLIPGLKHDVDILSGHHLDKDQSNLNKRCGPAHLRHRRCTTSCNDRLAVDACGCTLTQDLDPESAVALLSVPICDEEKLRSCVYPHLEQGADIYFDCMKECKTDCSPRQNPFTLKNKATSLEDIWAKDMIEMNLSFLNSASTVNSRPIMTSDKDAHQFIYIWVPIMVIAVVLVAFVLCYCAKRLM